MGSLFKDLSDESYYSKDMLDLKVTTELSDFMDSFMKNPIAPSFELFKAYAQIIVELLNGTAINFLKKHKTKIKAAYLPFPSNKLTFNIVLKNDTTSNRARLLDFIETFNRTPYAPHFKIVFTFIPQKLEKSISGEKIEL